MDESVFVVENRQKIIDLIRAVYIHETIRAEFGPGLGAQGDFRYTTAHSLMSKLSRELGRTLQLSDLDVIAERYKGLPEHLGYSNLVAISC